MGKDPGQDEPVVSMIFVMICLYIDFTILRRPSMSACGLGDRRSRDAAVDNETYTCRFALMTVLMVFLYICLGLPLGLTPSSVLPPLFVYGCPLCVSPVHTNISNGLLLAEPLLLL